MQFNNQLELYRIEASAGPYWSNIHDKSIHQLKTNYLHQIRLALELVRIVSNRIWLSCPCVRCWPVNAVQNAI